MSQKLAAGDRSYAPQGQKGIEAGPDEEARGAGDPEWSVHEDRASEHGCGGAFLQGKEAKV